MTGYRCTHNSNNEADKAKHYEICHLRWGMGLNEYGGYRDTPRLNFEFNNTPMYNAETSIPTTKTDHPNPEDGPGWTPEDMPDTETEQNKVREAYDDESLVTTEQQSALDINKESEHDRVTEVYEDETSITTEQQSAFGINDDLPVVNTEDLPDNIEPRGH